MIGVSYTGHDGRTRTASVNSPEEAAALMGGAGRAVPASRANPPGEPWAGRAVPGEPLLPGGSVVKSASGGLCLRGEELSPLVSGRRVFAAKDGGKGFFTLDEIDPPSKGAVVGKDTGDRSQSLDPDGDSREPSSPPDAAWSLRVQTDGRAEATPIDGSVTVYKYFRLIHFTAAGRVCGCSSEWREVAYTFTPGGAGGRWCVRPVFDSDDILKALRFGTSEELDIDPPPGTVKTVETTQCPNGGGD